MQLRLICVVLALVLLVSACASRTTRPATRPAPVDTSTGLSLPDAVVTTALDLRGVPYRYGGGDLSGFDCSGLTQYVFARHGIRLPRNTAHQYTVGDPVDLRDVQPGDLVFFQTVSRGPSHVGVAIGGNEFVHAPTTGSVVRVEKLTAIYWSRRVVGVRRVLPDTAPVVVAAATTDPMPALVEPPTEAPTGGITDTVDPPRPPAPARTAPRPRPFPGADTRR